MISELVRILLEANTPHDVIVAAVKAVEVQPIDVQAERRREKDRERKRCLRNSAESADTPLNGSNGFPHPSLTSLTPPKENPPKGGQKKGTRFFAETAPPEWIEFCKKERPDLNAGILFAGFKDYWLAKPGKDACKLDWFATWRNWVRSQKSGNVTYGNMKQKEHRAGAITL